VKVVLAPAARQDLHDGARFYAEAAGPPLAYAFITEFERSIAVLAEQPRIGASWHGAFRRLPMRRFPYSLVYMIGTADIRILAVAHQRRKPGFWRQRT